MKSLEKESQSALSACAEREQLQLRVIVESAEVEWFDRMLAQEHYLGKTPPVGDFLRQVVECGGRAMALLAWGSAALKLKDREEWIGWSASQRAERLKVVVQNRRYLLLHARGENPNLASQALGAACRALPAQWQERFGYRVLLAETFTDPESYAGTSYKASGWEPVGSPCRSPKRPDWQADTAGGAGGFPVAASQSALLRHGDKSRLSFPDQSP